MGPLTARWYVASLRIMVKKVSLSLSLSLSLASGLVAQAPSCEADFVAGPNVNLPLPWKVVGSVTPISETDGGCPPNQCYAEFRLDVEVQSPAAPGPAYQVCIGTTCFPTTLPHDPTKPTYTQSIDEEVTIGGDCAVGVEVRLMMQPLPGLAFVTIASGVLNCGSCPF